NYLLSLDLYTVISFAILFGIVFMVLIYKQTQKPKTYYQEEYQEEEEYQDSPVEESQYKVWLFIDLFSIVAFSLIVYTLFIKKINTMGFNPFGASILLTTFLYYFVIKPTLFNTKQK
ncbi:MAG: hypothetical protein ACRCR9_02215, partial [Chitinophagaceae bacterium]